MADVYERLRDRLDKFPQGFPKSKSGVELKILKDLFAPEEAEIALSLRPYPENVSAIAQRAGKDETELGETLYGMSKRGLIIRYRASETELYYFLVPWVVGIYEYQVNNLTKDKINLLNSIMRRRVYHLGGDGQWDFVSFPLRRRYRGTLRFNRMKGCHRSSIQMLCSLWATASAGKREQWLGTVAASCRKPACPLGRQRPTT